MLSTRNNEDGFADLNHEETSPVKEKTFGDIGVGLEEDEEKLEPRSRSSEVDAQHSTVQRKDDRREEKHGKNEFNIVNTCEEVRSDAANTPRRQYRDPENGVLSLGDKFLGDSGCVRLMQEIASSTMLIRLDLRGNHIGSDGADAIAEALRMNRTLRFLSLEWNRIGISDISVRKLASSLEVNQTLQDLDLRNNQIGPDAGVSLGRALRANVGLRRLDLRWNELGSCGGRKLVSAISDANYTLRDVLLMGNGVATTDSTKLEETLDRNRHPRVKEAVDEEKLANLARRLRFSSGLATSCEDPEEFLVVAREATRKLKQDEDEEDHRVFADRVVELEVHVKKLQDLLEKAHADLCSEREARNEVLRQAQTAQTQASLALEEKESIHTAFLRERSDRQLLQDEVSGLKSRNADLQKDLAELRDNVRDLQTENAALTRTVDREVQLRASIEESLASVRQERTNLLQKLDEERLTLSKTREEGFKERMLLEESLVRVRDEHSAELRKLEHQLEKVNDAHADEVEKLHSTINSREKEMEESTRKARERGEHQCSELRAKHAEELARANLQAETSRQELTDKLKKEHQSYVSQREVEHEAQTAQAVAVACEQAVEQALAEAVRTEVANACKELASEHKSRLWELEKRIREEAKLQQEASENKHEQDTLRFEAEIARQKDHIRDLERSHREEVAKLQERARRALGDVFRLESTTDHA